MKLVAVALKILITSILMFVFLSHIDFGATFELLLHPGAISGLAISAGLLVTQAGLAAFRQRRVVLMVGANLGYIQSLRIWFEGLFMSQVLITFVAGDIVRGVQLARTGVANLVAARAITLDRTLGFVAILALVALVVPLILPRVDDSSLTAGLVGLEVVCIGGIVAFFIGGWLVEMVGRLVPRLLTIRPVDIAIDLLTIGRFAYRGGCMTVLLMSAVMHLLNAIAIAAIAVAFGVSAPFWLLAAIALPVTLLMILPISFAGWGVREAALATGFGIIGIDAPRSVAISVTFGLSLLLVSLLGVTVLMGKLKDAKEEGATVLPAAPQSSASDRISGNQETI